MDSGKLNRLVDLQDDYKIKKAAAEEAEEAFKSLRDDIWEEMRDEGTKTVSIERPDGGTVRLTRTETIYGRVIDYDTAIKSLTEAGLAPELLKTVEQKGRLNELVREHLEQGRELPEGIDFYSQKPISITRQK